MLKQVTTTIMLTLCALILCTANPARAQLTRIEAACRVNGQFAYDMAIDRDRGVSLTDALLSVRQWVATNGATPVRLAYFEHVIRLVHELPELDALRHRRAQEMACI